MAGPEAFADIGVVLRPLVHVLDQQADRRPRRAAVIHAGEYLDLVRLLPLGGEAALTRAPFVQKRLDIRLRQGKPWRRAVDDAADRRAVTLAPGGDSEQMPEAVMRHDEPAYHAPRAWSAWRNGHVALTD